MDVKEYYNVDNLKDIYVKKIMYTNSVGTDNVSNSTFMQRREYYIKKICEEICNGTYKFKPYKIILIPKDVEKYPRKICIASVRDRIVIEALKNVIYDSYKNYNLNSGVYSRVSSFSETINSKKYDSYIQSDFKCFFDSIYHFILIKKLKKVIKDKWIINLINQVLKNDQKYNNSIIKNNIGVPQGLSISTLLANIYLLELDEIMKKTCGEYFRYIDDIFIFCKSKYKRLLYILLNIETKKLGLRLNREKTKLSSFNKNYPVEFLGYSIKGETITVKKKSIYKLEKSIEQLFKNYIYQKQKIEELEWRINIRISGAVVDNKKYGWLFYFSNINDLKLLYHLDAFVEKLKKRYKVENISVKKFRKVYSIIKSTDIFNSLYIFNVDRLNISEKIDIVLLLTNYEDNDVQKMPSEKIDYIYRKIVFKNIRDLERDLDKLS